MATPKTASTHAAVRRRIHVRGVVQGVGFRPFVFTLAKSLALTGHVFNSTSGVTIEIEGDPHAIDSFLATLQTDLPQLAKITDFSVTEVEFRGDVDFRIHHSHPEPNAFSLVPVDSGTCNDCWRDFGDPLNRRYGYPFTNCTHCGPRYTIIEDLPYDRSTTTMSQFTMCADCAAEYADPGDRRFHAQPNACSVCGPSLALMQRGSPLNENLFSDKNSLPRIHQARSLLRKGNILAVKGLGGFLLACDATNHTAVEELRKRKHRPAKPFALMARDVASVKTFCEISASDEAALLNARRPIVVLPLLPGTSLSPAVAPGNNTVGVMLPYTPLHYLLFSDSPQSDSEFSALVMTSGNLSEEPIVTSNAEAMPRLDAIADWFLLHNRDIATRVDDSVVRTFEGCERVLRRSRGFVPQAIDLGAEMHEVLAFGADLKNTFCLTKDRYAILSQHIGDLENYETVRFFEETLAAMKHLFRAAPRVIAHDLHPGYRSTQMAIASGIERSIGVQHHHAHVASCMAENHLTGRVIGVALDGTGYGTDGNIWGGEFFEADYTGFVRRAHLRYVQLPGGDAAVRQPWRMALSYLHDAFDGKVPGDIACLRHVDDKQIAVVSSMISRRMHTVDTSSCGRLFDAVAALCGVGATVTFEGQAAIALESIALPGIEDRYDFALEDGPELLLDFRPVIAAIVQELTAGAPPGTVSSRFHNTLSAAIAEVCSRIKLSSGLNRVCLSGGTFQNIYLLRHTVTELRRLGFEVFLHATVPANDGGISLGQAVIANALMQKQP